MNSIIKTTFNREADYYDESSRYLLLDYDEVLQKAVNVIPYRTNECITILDLGCGTGNLTAILRKQFPNSTIYALDFSEEMLSILRSKSIPEIKIVLADMFNLSDLHLPYFDVIVSSFCFHNFKSINEHASILSQIFNRLSVKGVFILLDLIDVEDSEKNIVVKNRLISQMRAVGLDDKNIVKWLGILQVEDSPLTISTNISLLNEAGFDDVNVNTYESNNAIFTAVKKMDIVQLKEELLFYGVRYNSYVKQLYLEQNPEKVWKTGNNGIFMSIDGTEVLISINHKANKRSPYEIVNRHGCSNVLKNGVKLSVHAVPICFPEWFFEKIPQLNDKTFSSFFVFEGSNYLHLAYKYCSFSSLEKCKFCSTKRRLPHCNDISIDELCIAIRYMLPKIPNSVHICLGGGTYIPFSNNVEFFSKIIRTIRSCNASIPIWVEMIPPSLSDIDRLIDDGASAFGFNIEIWDDNTRSQICPGKSQISKESYINACKHVIKKLGSNRVGSCLIAGLDNAENIKVAIDYLIKNGIQPCLLPYKSYNRTDLGEYQVPSSYKYDFYILSKYAATESLKAGILFSKNFGCLRCECCTIQHNFQNMLLNITD